MTGAISEGGKALLEGAIDLHLHAGPALRKRTGDAFDAAENGERYGMRGALLKDHDRLTAADAEIVNRRSGGRYEAFGSVCLNAPAGGLNPAAVETAGRFGARAVFLPTDNAANDDVVWSHHVDQKPVHVRSERPRRWTDRIGVLGPDGELTPAANEVLDACQAESLTVCTGHLGAQEVTAVIAAAHRLGLRVVVTHAPAFTEATMEQLHSWAATGAYLEMVYVFCCDGIPLPHTMRRTVAQEAAMIEALGPDQLVLSTDLGQQGNPPPADGLAAFASGLLAEGVPESHLELMMRVNPAMALGLDHDW